MKKQYQKPVLDIVVEDVEQPLAAGSFNVDKSNDTYSGDFNAREWYEE